MHTPAYPLLVRSWPENPENAKHATDEDIDEAHPDTAVDRLSSIDQELARAIDLYLSYDGEISRDIEAGYEPPQDFFAARRRALREIKAILARREADGKSPLPCRRSENKELDPV